MRIIRTITRSKNPKYKVGQKIYAVTDDGPISGIIEQIENDPEERDIIYYLENCDTYAYEYQVKRIIQPKK